MSAKELDIYGRRDPTRQEQNFIYAAAIFLIGVGLGSITALIYFILTNSTIKDALDGDGSIILAFLDEFGLSMPILVVSIGLVISKLGIQLLRHRTITSARWTIVAFTWMTVGAIVIGLFRFFTEGQPKEIAGESGFQFADAIQSSSTFFLIAIPLALSWFGMNSIVNTLFRGEESLSSANSRVAWNLLIPTVALLLIVAVRPLEETFVTSVTDKRFASEDQEVKFVGLDNYKNLLTFRFDVVDCRKDENGDCETNERTGKVRWELIERDLLEEGYRTADVYSIGGGRGIAVSGTDENFVLATFNTLRFTVTSVVLELTLGMIIALVVNSGFRGRGIMRAAMLVPWAIPTVVSARLWETMLRDNASGIVNKFALDVGLVDQSKAWLTEASLQMNAIIAVDVWKTAPFMALLILAGLQTMPGDVYEAAQVDGASRIRQFFSITLPLLRPTIAVALVFRTLDALRVFDVFQVLLGRQRLSMATYNFEQLISNRDAGYASAIGVVIFVVIFIFTAIYMRILGIESDQ